MTHDPSAPGIFVRALPWKPVDMKSKKNIHPILASVIAITACVGLAGCITTATTFETKKPAQPLRVSSVQLSEETSTLDVPGYVHTQFAEYLNNELYSRNAFQRGPQMTISWSFTGFEKGSRALRYFVGMGAGKGKIMVHARFLDQKGHEIATVDGNGTVVMGEFGGSYNSALRECAFEIGKYAKDNFSITAQPKASE